MRARQPALLRENRHIIYTTANDSHGDDVRKCEEAKPAINQQVHAHLRVGRLNSKATNASTDASLRLQRQRLTPKTQTHTARESAIANDASQP